MSKILLRCLLCVCLVSFWYGASASSGKERPKVGLVLSGGGAKGVAHVGALKVIEEAGIPVDIVVGTSMGSIIGGLYSIGYTPAQLDSIVRHLDWMNLLSDKTKRSDVTLSQKEDLDKYLVSIPFNFKDFKSVFSGVIKGDNLESLFFNLTRPYTDSISFDDLPIPYACVATDADTGEEVVFRSGYLYKSMRASMAIPTVLSPVEWNGRWLVDGGVKNNYPVDVAKAMGADIIIGVNVEDMNDTTAVNKQDPNAISLLFKLVMMGGQEKYLENVAETDVYIPVDMKGFSPASFGRAALDSINRRGYEAAMSKMPELAALGKKTGIVKDSAALRGRGYKIKKDSSHYVKIYDVAFKGFNSRETKWLKNNAGVKEGQYRNRTELDESVKLLRNTHPKAKIEVFFKDTLDGYSVEYVMSERFDNRLNLGMNVNTEEIATIIANADFSVNTPCPSMGSVTARFGKRNGVFGEYFFDPYSYGRIYFKVGAEYNTVSTYFQGSRFCDVAYFRPSFRFEFSDQTCSHNDLMFRLGAEVEYYDYVDTLYTLQREHYDVDSDFFINYFVGLKYDTYDRAYFPRKGSVVDVSASLYTDNGFSFLHDSPILAVSAYWQSVFSFNSRFSFIPSAFARCLVFSYDRTPFAYSNMLGGYTFGKYFASQMPFESVAHLEIFQDYDFMSGVALGFRERFFKNHYVYLTGNFAVLGNVFDASPVERMIYGGALRYAYDSFIGPLSASFAYSNMSKFGFYIHLGYVF